MIVIGINEMSYLFIEPETGLGNPLEMIYGKILVSQLVVHWNVSWHMY